MSENVAFPAHLSDRLRLVLLLDACESADLAPVPITRLHALAFLANVLSPIWSVQSYEGKILKRKGGPFYPLLQRELDCLVGLGVATIHDVRHEEENGQWRLEGSFALSGRNACRVIERAKLFEAERGAITFLRRLAFACARIARPLEQLVSFDATWSDKRTGTGDVIDFSEWRHANYSAYAATFFEKVVPKGIGVSRGDKLQLYMRLLERRGDGS
jgi:hypothetical protein